MAWADDLFLRDEDLDLKICNPSPVLRLQNEIKNETSKDDLRG